MTFCELNVNLNIIISKEAYMIKIVVDSTGYIPKDVLEKYDIKVVPLKIRLETKSLKKQTYQLKNSTGGLSLQKNFPRPHNLLHRIL
jgi:Uncharacterized protein conserved in bacteria